MSKQLQSIPLKNIKITGGFWQEKQKLIEEVVIPYQEAILRDEIPGAPRSHAIENFRIAAGESTGEFEGMPFQDTDVAKWLEASAYVLSNHPDPELEKRTDEMIRLIGKAQEEDGYLDTFYTLCGLKRWSNLREHHELYSAGHMIEAAVAYYQATGKGSLLKIMEKNADLLCATFGKDKLRGYSGHPEIELALIKLYHTTGKRKYLELAQYFLDERGTQPEIFQSEMDSFGPVEEDALRIDEYVSQKTLARLRYDEFNGNTYMQAHAPVRMQKKAAGHAVRALYLYTGMADLASEIDDPELTRACHTLWNNVVNTQMYVTGGVGATEVGEAFGIDYELPNDTVYAETCASIALMMFANRMLEIEPVGEYADIIEKELYNGMLSGMSLDGKGFFYVNPLEVIPGVSGSFPGHKHVLPRRFTWHRCACCPPNLARTIASLGSYAMSGNADTAFVHLYMDAEADLQVGSGIKLTTQTQYPWEGVVKITLQPVREDEELRLALRIPGWCHDYKVFVNGEEIFADPEKGYLYITRCWRSGDEVVLDMKMPVRRLYANTRVRQDAGCVALARGPVIYCLEEADNGAELSELCLPREAAPAARRVRDEQLGDIVEIRVEGQRVSGDGALYSETPPAVLPAQIRAIPYYAWCNRAEGGMRVWIREN